MPLVDIFMSKQCRWLALFCITLFMHNALAGEIISDIPTPAGFVRAPSPSDSYIEYLRALPLKSNKTIKTWSGDSLPDSTYNTLAVVDLPLLFNEDLEQCADFSMRFWAEYLNSINALDELSLFDFYGNKKPFSSKKQTFRDYLHWHMTHSNSYSISLGATTVNPLIDIQAGDMFVQNDSDGSIGHVSVVVDEAVNKAGLKAYLVGYSFMPAQQFHIEKATEEYGVEGWFTVEGYQQYAEHQFGSFGKAKVMRYEKHK